MSSHSLRLVSGFLLFYPITEHVELDYYCDSTLIVFSLLLEIDLSSKLRYRYRRGCARTFMVFSARDVERRQSVYSNLLKIEMEKLLTYTSVAEDQNERRKVRLRRDKQLVPQTHLTSPLIQTNHPAQRTLEPSCLPLHLALPPPQHPQVQVRP